MQLVREHRNLNDRVNDHYSRWEKQLEKLFNNSKHFERVQPRPYRVFSWYDNCKFYVLSNNPITPPGPYTDKGFNFGSSGSVSSELAEQAREMVAVLESDTRIDMNTDWKLITLSSGQTDLCHLSCKSGATDQDFVQNIKQALDILFTLPNIIIQVVSPLGRQAGRIRKT